MAEYIEREALIEHMQECKDENAFTLMATGYAYSFIEAAPSANVVEVVRCKDCRMFVDNKSALTTHCTRERKNLNVKPDDFCSYGERRCEDG